VSYDLKELQRLEASNPWRGEWVARTFEIDCPCPNGVDCGAQHTCEEVESPESYPDGQCVVQISVPGLETFAVPVARYIAALHNAAPELLERMAKLESLYVALRAEWSQGDIFLDEATRTALDALTTAEPR
jgi:hypothetical protein